MYNSRECTKSKHKSPEKQILTWIRKRISSMSWGTSSPDKSDLHCHTSKADIKRSFRCLRLGGKPHFLGPIRDQLFGEHFNKTKIAYFQSDGRSSCPETLALIDIDCHESGSWEGAVECVEWLRSNGFPGLFYGPSTNGRGIHALFRIDKRNEAAESLDDGLKLLEKWLMMQWKIHRWNIQGIEIKGRPLVMKWGDEKYELLDVSMGSLAKVPIDALDRPEELMNTTLKTVTDLRRLGSEAVRLRRLQMLDFAVGVPTDASGLVSTPPQPDDFQAPHEDLFGKIEFDELGKVKWFPSMRNREWPKWIMHIAKNGLQQDDKLGEVIHELAKWLIWVELYDLENKEETTVELLERFLAQKHNGRVSRLTDGRVKSVREQVRRCVKLAHDISYEGKAVMAQIRQKREGGQYLNVYEVRPLLSGFHSEAEHTSSPSIYSTPLRSHPLPPQIEAQISQIAKTNKMRRGKDGELPILRFARHLLNGLWDSGGQARIGQEKLNEMAGNKKEEQQTAYKALLRDAGLILDWQGTYRAKTARSLYRLSDETMALFSDMTRAESRIA